MKVTLTLIALTLGLFVSTASAAPDAARKKKANPEKVFNKKDKDHDNALTKTEFVHGAKHAEKKNRAFDKKDKDADGKLTLSEFKGPKEAGKKKKKRKNQ